MSSSLPFVPRHVAKGRKVPQITLKAEVDVKGKARASDNNDTSKEKEREKTSSTSASTSTYSNEDLATLTVLSISDYALWTDGDLRRKVDWASSSSSSDLSRGDNDVDTDSTGFIPLTYILKHSSFFASQNQPVPENAIAKALRTCAPHLVDVRMVLSAPNWRAWDSSSSSSKADAGMYEVRRKEWARTELQTSSSSLQGGFSKGYWDERTVYLENIPIPYRTVPGIVQFVAALLDSSTSSSSSTQGQPNSHSQRLRPRVESILFPPHHLDKDKPGDRRAQKCKGFAFAILSDLEDVKKLVERWPWKRDRGTTTTTTTKTISKTSTTTAANTTATATTATHPQLDADTVKKGHGASSASISPVNAESDAFKHGFRTLPKRRYETLKEEYEAWRRRILDELVADGSDTANRHPQAEYVEGDAFGDGDDIGDGMDVDNTDGVSGRDVDTRNVDTGSGSGSKKRTRKRKRGILPDADTEERDPPTSSLPPPKTAKPTPTSTATSAETLIPDAPYPPSCLLHVKNIHPETNKTTLKALFGRAFTGFNENNSQKHPDAGPGRKGKGGGTKERAVEGGGIDYVDFSKGIDTCYLRLSTPSHARHLLDYFTTHQVVQKGGLDDVGCIVNSNSSSSLEVVDAMGPGPASSGRQSITMSLTLARPEQLYWEKVPAKVRAEAVRRCLALSGLSGG